MSDNYPSRTGLSYDQVQNMIEERLKRISQTGGGQASAHLPAKKQAPTSWYKRFRQLLGI